MFLGTEKEVNIYHRPSKTGVIHEYSRTQTLVLFRCDNCGETFRRPKEKISPKRLNNNYFHCCEHCDAKRFAQKKGVERRLIWYMPVSSTRDISRL